MAAPSNLPRSAEVDNLHRSAEVEHVEAALPTSDRPHETQGAAVVPADVDPRFARVWGKAEAPDATPTILVSSRDGADVPHVAGAAKLAKVAEAAGWTARLTYALAAVPESFYLNGKLKAAAHRLASVAVRLARGTVRGWAVWHRTGDGTWRFAVAYLGLTKHGAKSIVEAVSVA